MAYQGEGVADRLREGAGLWSCLLSRTALKTRSSSASATKPYVNRFGRRPGRGWRPWLLLPKVIAVAMWTGGLAVAVFIAWHVPASPPAPTGAVDAAHAELNLLSHLFAEVLGPAFVAALVLGIGLLFQHPRIFLKARWCQIKILLIVSTLPACGVLGHRSLAHLQTIQLPGDQWLFDVDMLRWTLTISLIASILILIIGRLKPRFGQRYGEPNQKRSSPDAGRAGLS